MGPERTPRAPKAERGRVRLLQALPALAFVATFGFFFLDKGRQARTVFGSGRGLLAVAVIVGGYLVVGFFLRRFVRWAWLPPIALTVVVLGLAAWIVRPYYTEEPVERALVTGPVDDVAMDEPVAEADPPPGPVRVSTGGLQGIDHDASGEVSVIDLPDGSQVVRFSDFDIEGTPDSRVHLVEGEDVRDLGGIELGELPGTQGEVLDFEVPAGEVFGPGWTVLVWCHTFAVPIANATQGSL
ncbi:hypothetical protein BH24ACT3_BH24ACT3_01750 [soil metagenome]